MKVYEIKSKEEYYDPSFIEEPTVDEFTVGIYSDRKKAIEAYKKITKWKTREFKNMEYENFYGCRIYEWTLDKINEYEDVTWIASINENLIRQKLEETKTVVTHFGDDLDNKSSIYALEKWAKEQGILYEDESLQVDRVPAGQIKEGMLNIDTGGHKGNRKEENDTLIIDGDPENGVKSAAESLSNSGIYVPEQIVELADTMPNKVSALDSRSGLALIRYLTGEQAFKLAEAKLLDKSLTDEQIKEFGLEEAHEKQQAIIDNAVEKIKKYTKELPNGEKIVLAPEQILAGSAIAYEMGIPYYASASNHLDQDKNVDGVTFAITSKPGTKLPEEILEYGKELEEQYRIDENTSGVFVNPNGQMIVAGGFKNLEFKIPNETIEGMLSKIEERFTGKETQKEEQAQH